MDTTQCLDAKLERMRAVFAPMRNLIVAFSGGVDSTFVLKVAHETLGDAVLALTTTSPTMPDEDRESALAMARLIGARHLVVESNELEIPGYAANPLNRCYLCKHNLFTVCEAKAAELGIDEIVDGLNLDDLHDYRPGMQAASEKRVRHPLVEAEMTKADVRELSRAMGLPTWDRPASPCLSSRFPYGTEITPAGLEKVAAGEKLLHSMGFAVARVRYHGDVARLELEQSEIARVFEPAMRETIEREFKKIGFRFVAIDLKGFRSGSLNEGVIANSTIAGGYDSSAAQSSLTIWPTAQSTIRRGQATFRGRALIDSSGETRTTGSKIRSAASSIAAVAAAMTALLYEFVAAAPGLWPCGLLAPLPILAVAPEIRTARAAQLAFLAFLVGNLVAWGGESLSVPLIDMLASHLAGAVVFAAFVACAAEATRRWSGWLAALVFPTLEVAFYFTLSTAISARHLGQPRLFASRVHRTAADYVVARSVRRGVRNVAAAVGAGGGVVPQPMEHGRAASGADVAHASSRSR